MHFTAKRASFTLMERPFLDLPVFALQGRSVQCLRPRREASFVRAAREGKLDSSQNGARTPCKERGEL